MISSMYVRIPKCEVPILAEKKKKRCTDIIDEKIRIQDGVSNSFTRFQVGGILVLYLENQYSGIYLHPGAQVDTFSRPA